MHYVRHIIAFFQTFFEHKQKVEEGRIACGVSYSQPPHIYLKVRIQIVTFSMWSENSRFPDCTEIALHPYFNTIRLCSNFQTNIWWSGACNFIPPSLFSSNIIWRQLNHATYPCNIGLEVQYSAWPHLAVGCHNSGIKCSWQNVLLGDRAQEVRWLSSKGEPVGFRHGSVRQEI